MKGEVLEARRHLEDKQVGLPASGIQQQLTAHRMASEINRRACARNGAVVPLVALPVWPGIHRALSTASMESTRDKATCTADLEYRNRKESRTDDDGQSLRDGKSELVILVLRRNVTRDKDKSESQKRRPEKTDAYEELAEAYEKPLFGTTGVKRDWRKEAEEEEKGKHARLDTLKVGAEGCHNDCKQCAIELETYTTGHTEGEKRMFSGRKSNLTYANGELRRRGDERPWAECPLFNYERFSKEFVPSEKMMLEIFPNDPPARTRYLDVRTEHEILNMFNYWAEDFEFQWQIYARLRDCQQCIYNQARRWRQPFYTRNHDQCGEFHGGLLEELKIDSDEVEKEYNQVKRSLTDLQMWQMSYLDLDGEMQFAKECLEHGKRIFAAIGGDEALARYGHRLGPLPSDDLATWEKIHLGKGGTLSPDQRLGDHMRLLTPEYYGGIQAREKYLSFFEAFGSMQLWELGDLLRQGRDVYWIQRMASKAIEEPPLELARSFFPDLPALRRDLATWEYFQLDEDGDGTTKIEQMLELGANPFDASYFGSEEARLKWGYLLWEHRCLMVAGNSLASLAELIRKGRDVFRADSRRYKWDDASGDSARARYSSYIPEWPSWWPKHDTETWEMFHCPDGDTEKLRAYLATYDADWIFEPWYYGGVQARAKYGHLAPGWMKMQWDAKDV